MDIRLQQNIVKLYRMGYSMREIGQKLTMSHEAVRRAIPQEIRRRQRMDNTLVKRILQSYHRTGSYQETANELNLDCRQTVYRIVEQSRRR